MTITPTVPPLHTSRPLGSPPLVNFETWFWARPPVDETENPGDVSVRVVATARELVIDWRGHRSLHSPAPGRSCDTSRPASAQSSDCTRLPAVGEFTLSVTVVYSLTWRSGAETGKLQDITPTDQFTLPVNEGQAVIVD